MMIRILAIIFSLLAIAPANAQFTKAAMQAQIASCFPDQNQHQITPAITRQCLDAMVNSYQQYTGLNAQTGTSYSIATGDYGQLVTFNNASSVAVSLSAANATGFNPFNFYAKNLGAGVVTITPASGTINGDSSFALATGLSAYIVSDGVNWQVWGNCQTATSSMLGCSRPDNSTITISNGVLTAGLNPVPTTPGGRLTAQSGVPVPNANVSSTSTFYDTCDGSKSPVEPIPNGTGFTSLPITSCQISIVLDSTHHTAGGTSFTGYIVGDALHVTAATANVLAPLQIITGSNVPSGVMIISQTSGTTGGVGVYAITNGLSSLTGTISSTTLTMTAFTYGDGSHYSPVTAMVLSGTGITGTPSVSSYGAAPGTYSISASETVASPETITGTLTVASSGSPESMTATGLNAYGVYLINNSGSLVGCVSPNAWYAGSQSGQVISYTYNGATVEQVHNTLGLWTNVSTLTHCWNNSVDFGPISADNARYKGAVIATTSGNTSMLLKPTPTTSAAVAIVGIGNVDNQKWLTATSQDSIGSPWNSFSIGNPIPCNFTNSSTNFGQNYQVQWVDPLGQTQWQGYNNAGAISSGLTANANMASTMELSVDFIPFGGQNVSPFVEGQYAAKPVSSNVQNQGGMVTAQTFPFSTIGTHFLQCEEGSINASYNANGFFMAAMWQGFN